MKNVGFIGWRGMVGSVLMQRMVEERGHYCHVPGRRLHQRDLPEAARKRLAGLLD